MKINFSHHQSAHCENGVISNLMKHNGFNISEPMAFGIGSGLLFCYIPFLMVNHAPAFTYRAMPGFIFKSTILFIIFIHTNFLFSIRAFFSKHASLLNDHIKQDAKFEVGIILN